MMSLSFSIETPKELVFETVAEYLHQQGLKIDKQDSTRPWGVFLYWTKANLQNL